MPFDTLSHFAHPSTYTADFIIDAGTNAMVTGPVILSDVTINGNLTVTEELDTTGTITLVGSLRII